MKTTTMSVDHKQLVQNSARNISQMYLRNIKLLKYIYLDHFQVNYLTFKTKLPPVGIVCDGRKIMERQTIINFFLIVKIQEIIGLKN
jgi:hypothetical protein